MKKECQNCGAMKNEREFRADPEVCQSCLDALHEEAVEYCESNKKHGSEPRKGGGKHGSRIGGLEPFTTRVPDLPRRKPL